MIGLASAVSIVVGSFSLHCFLAQLSGVVPSHANFIAILVLSSDSVVKAHPTLSLHQFYAINQDPTLKAVQAKIPREPAMRLVFPVEFNYMGIYKSKTNRPFLPQ